MKTQLTRFLLTTVLAASLPLTSRAQTYSVADLGTIGTNASFATGINASGQVSGYSASGTNAARAWRYTPGVGLVDLGSFGGADNRALGINNAGQVTVYWTDTNGIARGFVFGSGALTDIGGPDGGAGIFPQHINSAGKVVGFSSATNGDDTSFLFTSPNAFSNRGTIANATLPASSPDREAGGKICRWEIAPSPSVVVGCICPFQPESNTRQNLRVPSVINVYSVFQHGRMMVRQLLKGKSPVRESKRT